MTTRNKYLMGMGAGAVALILVAGGTAMAAGKTAKSFTPPAAVGTVASVSGNTITLTGKNGATYTVDASSATVTKFTPGTSGSRGTSATITVSQIQTGDTLVVQGTASGDNVTATKIMDGMSMSRGKMAKPAASGTVAAVNGNSLTVTGKNGVTYTVDAANAKINKITPGSSGAKPTRSSISVSGILVGDTVVVQGTASGNNITATSITDGVFGNWYGRGPVAKPAAVGTVASVSGNTITLTGKNGATYTVDASSATVTKFTPGTSGSRGTSATITVSQIQTGDTLVVQGTASGDNVTATKIMDGTFARGNFGHGRNKPVAAPAK